MDKVSLYPRASELAADIATPMLAPVGLQYHYLKSSPA